MNEEGLRILQDEDQHGDYLREIIQSWRFYMFPSFGSLAPSFWIEYTQEESEQGKRKEHEAGVGGNDPLQKL